MHSPLASVPSQAHLLAQAHVRSQGYGVSPQEQPDYQRLGVGALQHALEENHFLYQHATPVMEHLFSQIANTGSMLVLTSADGLVLHSLGDSDFLATAGQVALVPGVNWSEQVQGTNAIGTALQARQAITVQGSEHFMQVNHRLACSCAPIFDPQGQVLGALDVTSEHHRHHPHTLALVRMSVHMLENQMMVARFAQAVQVRFHARAEFLGTLMEGLAIFSHDGQLLSANRSAQFQLGLGLGPDMPTVYFDGLFHQPWSALLRGQTSVLTLASGVHVHCRVQMPNANSCAQASASARIPSHLHPHPQAQAHSAPICTPSPCALADLETGDPHMQAVVHKMRRLLDKDIPIMLLGETGCGKEVLAQAWHHSSARADQAFVAINCAAIPEALMESELFGYAEGAFTGARKKGHIGKIAQAHRGTLFLDEIGDMPLHLQTRLLRVLQERSITPLGSGEAQPVDMALVCATHKNLHTLMEQGLFRADLYYRLNGLVVQLPPLRARSDVLVLAQRILRQLQAPQQLAPQVQALLLQHPWPGNLRQMHSVLRIAAVLAEGEANITCAHLPEDFLQQAGSDPVPATQPLLAAPPPPPSSTAAAPQAALQDVTLQAMAQALARHQGNVSAAARALGISRNSFYRKKALLQRYSDCSDQSR